MKRFIQARPTPAMAVAFTALLLALGGTAVALPGTNTVDSGDIRNNSIRAADLRSRSLDGTDIKINRVGGNAIKEEGLELEKIGKVPLAELADRATAADSATTAENVGPNGVNTAAIQANAVNSAKVADNSLTGGDVLEGSLSGADVSDGSLTGADIADNTLGAADLDTNSVTSAEIANGQVRAPDVGPVTTRSSSETVATGTSVIATVSCLSGEVRLGGGGFYTNSLENNKGLQATFPFGNSGWAVVGRNNTGDPETLNVNVLCLQN